MNRQLRTIGLLVLGIVILLGAGGIYVLSNPLFTHWYPLFSKDSLPLGLNPNDYFHTVSSGRANIGCPQSVPSDWGDLTYTEIARYTVVHTLNGEEYSLQCLMADPRGFESHFSAATLWSNIAYQNVDAPETTDSVEWVVDITGGYVQAYKTLQSVTLDEYQISHYSEVHDWHGLPYDVPEVPVYETPSGIRVMQLPDGKLAILGDPNSVMSEDFAKVTKRFVIDPLTGDFVQDTAFVSFTAYLDGLYIDASGGEAFTTYLNSPAEDITAYVNLNAWKEYVSSNGDPARIEESVNHMFWIVQVGEEYSLFDLK